MPLIVPRKGTFQKDDVIVQRVFKSLLEGVLLLEGGQ